MVIGDDWNWPYIGLLGSVAQWSLETVLTRLESSPNSLPELTVPCPPAWGDSVARSFPWPQIQN